MQGSHDGDYIHGTANSQILHKNIMNFKLVFLLLKRTRADRKYNIEALMAGLFFWKGLTYM